VVVGWDAETVKLTGIDWGVLVAPVAVTLIVAEYAPAARPVIFAVAAKELGAVSEVGEMESHEASVLTLQPKGSVPDLEMATACSDGLLPPWVAENTRLVGLRLILEVEVVGGDVAAETVKLTGIDWGVLVAPVAVTLTVAEYVPAASPGMIAVAVNEPAPVPEVGETESHDPSVLTLQLNFPVPELEIATACPDGLLPPWLAEKASLIGLRLMVTVLCPFSAFARAEFPITPSGPHPASNGTEMPRSAKAIDLRTDVRLLLSGVFTRRSGAVVKAILCPGLWLIRSSFRWAWSGIQPERHGGAIDVPPWAVR
jgi:hypothetical protein